MDKRLVTGYVRNYYYREQRNKGVKVIVIYSLNFSPPTPPPILFFSQPPSLSLSLALVSTLTEFALTVNHHQTVGEKKCINKKIIITTNKNINGEKRERKEKDFIEKKGQRKKKELKKKENHE